MTATADANATGRQELPSSMVERMTRILDVFEGPRDHATLEQICRATHLPRSTAHRILDQLVRLDWLDHTSVGYRLGRRSLSLGGGTQGFNDIRSAAAPYLHDLSVRTGAVIHLAVLQGDQVNYLDKVGGRFAVTVPSRVGGMQPAHCTALGKAILAWHDPDAVDEILAERLVAQTRATIVGREALHAELHRIRQRGGLAFERGESFAELACAAVAIHGPDGPVAAISAVGPSDIQIERVAPLVVNAAKVVTRELYPRMPEGRRRMSPMYGG